MATLGRKLIRAIKSSTRTVYSKKTGKIDWIYLFYEIRETLLDKLLYSWLTPLVVFQESCIRTWKWLPIIWKDRHWDHAYILDILQHKIRFTREHIQECRRHTTWKRDCRNMLIAELLIKRIREDNYCETEMDEIYEKYGTLRRNFCEKDEFGNSIWVGPSPEEWKESKKIYKKQKYLKDYDYDFLFKHLKKHLEKWWD